MVIVLIVLCCLIANGFGVARAQDVHEFDMMNQDRAEAIQSDVFRGHSTSDSTQMAVIMYDRVHWGYAEDSSGGRGFSLTTNIDTYILADTIVLDGDCSMSIGFSNPSAKVTIAARHILCSPWGRLFVVGGKVNGGRLVIIADDVSYDGSLEKPLVPKALDERLESRDERLQRPPSQIVEEAGVPKPLSIPDDEWSSLVADIKASPRPMWILTRQFPNRTPARSYVGFACFGTVKMSVNEDYKSSSLDHRGALHVSEGYGNLERELPASVYSAWVTGRLQHLAKRAIELEATGNRVELFALFRETASLLSQATRVSEMHTERFRAVRAELTAIRSRALPRVYTATLPLAGTQEIRYFLESDSIDAKLAPTDCLVVPRTGADGRIYAGVAREQTRDGRLYVDLSVNVKLVLDPRLAAMASEELAKSGLSVDGEFSNWELFSGTVAGTGVVESSITPLAGTLQVALTLDAERATDTLWRLTSTPGLPLTVTYKCLGDEQIKGRLHLALSLARRHQHALSVRNRRILNSGPRAVSIEYLQTGKGRIVVPPGANAVVVTPKESRFVSDCGILPNEDATGIKIPASAVTQLGAADPTEDFEFARSLFEKITVKNLLPGHDSLRNTDLRFVEITLYQVVDGADHSSVGPVKLAPAGAAGSELPLTFVRPGNRNRHYRLEGTAYYTGDGKDSFSLDTINGVVVDITESVLEP